jgi:phosphocarrier protein HPr
MGLWGKRSAFGKVQKEVTILNKLGLHARPAAMFVRAANKHRAEIWVEKDGEQVNGRSIMGLMMLSAGQGTKLILSAEGADAAKAIRELELLIEKRFDEESYLNER